MKYGKNARVGNITVFSRKGAENAYRILASIFYKEMTMEASCVMSSAMLDMFALGFTSAECEAIELSAIA